MPQPIDLNTVDSPQVLMYLPSDYISSEEIYESDDVIKNQYINFNNLGVNIVTSLQDKIKMEIYSNILEYANDNYLSIVDYDACAILPQKRYDVGEKIYTLLCVDFFNTILPNFLNKNNCISIENFDSLFKHKYKNNFNTFKNNILKTIKSIIDGLLRLQEINPKVRDDLMYKKLLEKYTYYIELIDFGESERFITNYVRPVLSKNFESILWRLS